MGLSVQTLHIIVASNFLGAYVEIEMPTEIIGKRERKRKSVVYWSL